MGKVQNEMATRITVDSVGAVKSYKALTDAVKGSMNAWKASEVQLRSAGNYQEAAKTKVEGLTKSIDLQKGKLAELKARQQDVDKSTKEGQEAYFKLENQIASATRQLGNYEGQLNRAKSSSTYYTSGLADLQKGYRQSTALSESYVKRLEAEGRSVEANKAKLSGLKQVYSNMEAQYKAQTNELDRIKTASGATSDAYKRQQVRVNETATAMAKAKTSQNELLKAMEKEPHAFMHGVQSKLDSIDDKAKKTSHLFGTILGAHLVANGITNAIGQITASFGALKDSVVQYDNKQRTMTATWTTLTGSNGKGKQMVNIGNELASAFNQNINVVDELNQSFYHVFDNAPRTKELTKSILTLGDTLNLSDENVTRLGTNFTHMLSSGKMQLGDFNMINDQLPMYAGKMLEFERKQQHNSKLTMSTLRDQMSAGKISAKDAEEVMNSLGGKYAKASENLMKTIPGMQRSIRTQMPALLDAIYKPIANMKSPLMGQFTKWIGDKNTKAEFKDVGSALALQIKDISKAFAGKNFNVGDTLDKMLANLAKGIDKVGANIIAHKKEIKSFFSSMKTASKTSFNVFVQSLKDIEPILKIVGGFAEKHPKVFAGLASSAFVASRGISALKLAFTGLDLAKSLGGKLGRLVLKPKVDGAEGKRELTLFGKAVKGTAKGIGKGLKWTAKIAYKGASKSVGLLWKATKGTSKLIGRGLSWTAKIAYKGASKAFSVLGAGIKTLGKSFLSLGRLLLANPIGLVLTAVIALGVAFYEAYKHIKPFREWVNKTFKSVVNFGKGIAKWGSNVGKSVGRALSSMSKKWNSFKNSFRKAWNSHWAAIGKSLRNVWNSSIKNIRNFFRNIAKGFSSFGKSFKKAWNNTWNSIKKFFYNIFNGIYKTFKSWTSAISRAWNGFKKWFGKVWHGMWNGIHNFFHGITTKLSKTFSGWISGTMDALGSFGNKFTSGWNGLVKGVKDIFSGLWKDLKGFARDGMNDVIDLINGGINAVDSVIHTFGGKKKTIGDLSHVHFAEGTGMFSGSRNPITRPTMAMLNDGNDSPQTGNKEMVMLPNGDSGIVQGRNTKMMLPAGTEVLSASETAMVMAMQGVTKYAKGTGFFGDILNSVTSGISGVTSWVGKKVSSLEKFFNTAEKIIAHPIKSLENLISWSSKGISGVMSNIGHGLFSGVEKQAKTWWSTLWGGVSDSLDSGASSSTLVNAMMKYGATNKYVYGAEGPSAFDCSGLVEYTLKKLGISFPRTSGEQYKASKHVSNPKPGDLVFFGPGGSEHVGVYTGNGEFYSAENEKDGMGISKVHGGGYGTFAGYGRVPGLSDSTDSSKSSKSSGLLGTIKKQVGSGFWKFISKLADEFGDGGSSNPGGSGVQRWKPDVIKALKKNGFEASASQVSAWMKVIARESNGDPSVVNHWDSNAKMGMPSMGLVQTIRPTFEAYKFPGHNNPLNGYDDLLAGIHYMKAKYGSGPSAFARVSGPEGYENGGIINTNQLIEVAEHNKPEMVLPLTNKSRANQLISQASQVVNGNTNTQVASTNSESNEKLDKVIELLTALVSGQGSVQAFIAKSDVINTIKSDNKTASQYSQMMGY